jgi:hypothetical protein
MEKLYTWALKILSPFKSLIIPVLFCSECKELLPAYMFAKHSRMVRGYQNNCKECSKRRWRTKYAAKYAVHARKTEESG